MTEESKDIHIYCIDEAEEAPDLEPIWGNWIFRESVILQAGEPGISKTTFNYSFAKAIVDNKPFLGVAPIEPDLCVFIIDWESSRMLIKSRMRAMGYPTNVKQLRFYNDPNFTIYDIVKAMSIQCVKPDIIFIDPIRYAFNMKDENDNAEASRQAKYLRQVATEFHCAIVIVHHSSKAEMSGWKKASGASSRTALADICMNFDGLGDNNKGEPIYPDLFKLTIPKNRMMDDHFKVFVRKDDNGRTFTICDPPKGYQDTEYDPATKRYTVQQAVRAILSPVKSKSPSEIQAELEAMGHECSRQSIHKALNHLVTLSIAEQPDYGKYIKNQHK